MPLIAQASIRGEGEGVRRSAAHQNDPADTPSCGEARDGARRAQAAAAFWLCRLQPRVCLVIQLAVTKRELK